MYLAGPKRWLDNRLGPSRLGLSEGDDWRIKGRFRVKQLTDICLAPTVGISQRCHSHASGNPDLSNLPISEKTHKKTATIEAEAPTMTVGKVAW